MMNLLLLCILLLVGVVVQGATNAVPIAETTSKLTESSVSSFDFDVADADVPAANVAHADFGGGVFPGNDKKQRIVRRRNEKLFVVENTGKNDEAISTKTTITAPTIDVNFSGEDQHHLGNLYEERGLSVDDIKINLDTPNNNKDYHPHPGVRELFWDLPSTNNQTCMSDEMLQKFHEVLLTLVHMTPSGGSPIGRTKLDALKKMTDFFGNAKSPPDLDFSMPITGASYGLGGGTSGGGRRLEHFSLSA